MGTLIVAHPTNGAKASLTARILPLAAPQVDRLLDLRASLKRLQAEERALTAELVGVLEAQGLRALQGTRAVAVLDQRTSLRVDPELFHRAVGPAAFGAMTVRVEAARTLLGAADLAAISEATMSPVLRVEPVALGVA